MILQKATNYGCPSKGAQDRPARNASFGQAIFWLLCGVLLFSTGFSTAAESVTLTNAQAVRRLTVAEAESHLQVQLKGVVTFFNQNLFSRFIQDGTAGIYLRESTNIPSLKPGDLVEVTGITSQGEYAPVVEPTRVRVLGTAPLPPAQPTTFEKLASGAEDSQFVEISGIVRSVSLEPTSQFYIVTLATGAGRLAIFTPQIPVPANDLVDSTVRARGVCSTLFNRQRQLFAIRLMVPRPQDLMVETPAGADPFSVPTRTIGSLLQFSPESTYGHRVKLVGTVVLQNPGNMIFIQNRKFGLQVRTTQTDPLKIGDRVEVLGFPKQGQYTPVLEDSVYRKIRSGPPPVPDKINVDAALSGIFDSRLVQLEATLLDRARQNREQFLVLDSGKFIFQAHLGQTEDEDPFAHLKNGSKVSVTGVCLIEPGDWMAGEQWRARAFRLLLRSAEDVKVLKAPPWWTLRKLLWMTGALLVVVLAALAWVAVLRRRVQKQTAIIREQMVFDAALKERYEDLFENANDMVFTHDLRGRVTSINRAGERLLQRNRDEILETNIIRFVAEDEREAALDWLQNVGKGAEPETTEWDFINSEGQRVKVEISSRLVEQNGKNKEIESVARDITERRRLERELLEASNREQRRIGHDLHDGVCQQLAGIAYRVDILGDLLQEGNRPEAAEADKIGALISEATVQARSVARGLFPVRLEENGLIAALDELADGASNRFPVECNFECPNPQPSVIDNNKALHLYYIAQEALVNAVKHGKATTVGISVRKAGERYCLQICDNGSGFETLQAGNSGMGLRIMHYRARVIGATLEVKSTPGTGTEISCYFVPVGT